MERRHAEPDERRDDDTREKRETMEGERACMVTVKAREMRRMQRAYLRVWRGPMLYVHSGQSGGSRQRYDSSISIASFSNLFFIAFTMKRD